MKKLLNYHSHWGISKTSNLLWLDHVDSQFANRSTSTGSHVLCNKFEEIFWFHLYEEIQSMVYIGLRKLWKTSFPCSYTILPFWPFTPSYDYPGSVNDFSAAALDFEWNICISFFLFIKKDVGVESFHDEKFKFNFFKLLQIRWRPTFYKEESDDRDSCTAAGLLSRVHMLTHRPRLFKSIVTFNKW